MTTRLPTVLLSSIGFLIAIGLFACGGDDEPASGTTSVEVKVVGFNDLHGNLEPPKVSISAPAMGASAAGTVLVPAGGAAYLASAIAKLKLENPNSAVVSAGDMIGASPLVSSLFLDEPTIDSANLMQIDFNAVGNHEFDKGEMELLRMKNGGCEKNTKLEPCQVNKTFAGANFGFLSANVVKSDGTPLFATTGIKTFTDNGASVKVGFIGLTLKGTPALVTPTAVSGLTFKDEAETANALIPQLKAQGADAIVVVLHEGGRTAVGYNDPACTGLSGDILPILEKLDAQVDVVLSGHTHKSYICDYGKVNPAKPFLLTSAGEYGTLITDINLKIDAKSHKVTAKSATNIIVQGEGYTRGTTVVPLTDQYPSFAKHAAVADLVSRYVTLAQPLVQRVVGRIKGDATRTLTPSGESVLGNMIADANLASTAAPAKGGAQIAFMNSGGVRADLIPDANGNVTFGQLVSVNPFGGTLVVKTFTGAQIRTLLEQQFNSGTNTAQAPKVLLPSRGLTYSYNLALAPNARVSNLLLNGSPIVDTDSYRIAMNSYLATGGDNFAIFTQGTNVVGGDKDVESLEAYITANDPTPLPATDRIANLSTP